jgi:hypothetical protein
MTKREIDLTTSFLGDMDYFSFETIAQAEEFRKALSQADHLWVQGNKAALLGEEPGHPGHPVTCTRRCCAAPPV